MVGAFRFDHEFDQAVALLGTGLDVDPIISHTVPLGEASAAFDITGNRRIASKVLLDLTTG